MPTYCLDCSISRPQPFRFHSRHFQAEKHTRPHCVLAVIDGQQTLPAFHRSVVGPLVLWAHVTPIAVLMPPKRGKDFFLGNDLQYMGCRYCLPQGKGNRNRRKFQAVPPRVSARNPWGVRTLKIILLEMVSWISEPMCLPLAAYRSSHSIRVTLIIRPLMMWGVSHWISPFISPGQHTDSKCSPHLLSGRNHHLCRYRR